MKPIFEPIELGKEKTLTCFRYDKKNFEMPWHFHPQHELTFIEESIGTKFIGDYVGNYSPGELVLLRSNLPHCWKNQLHKEGNSKSVVIQWNKGIIPKIPELASIHSMLNIASRGIIFSTSTVTPFVDVLLKLPELDSDDLYLQLTSMLLGLSKCSYRTLSKVSFTDDISTEYSGRMTKIYDFVAANYDRKIYLRELAELANMSEQSFSRFFTKMMGRPFFNFLNEYRINMAARMLLDTDDAVAEIGFASGYESLPFFHRQFNKFKGCTPLAYQRKYHPTFSRNLNKSVV